MPDMEALAKKTWKEALDLKAENDWLRETLKLVAEKVNKIDQIASGINWRDSDAYQKADEIRLVAAVIQFRLKALGQCPA